MLTNALHAGVQWQRPAWVLVALLATVGLSVWSWRRGRRGAGALSGLLLRSSAMLGLALLAAGPESAQFTDETTATLVVGGRAVPPGAVRAARWEQVQSEAAATLWLPPVATPLSLSDSLHVALLLPQLSALQVLAAVDGTEPLRFGAALRPMKAQVLPAFERVAAPFSALRLLVQSQTTMASSTPLRLQVHSLVAGPAQIQVLVDGHSVEQREVFVAAGATELALADLHLPTGRHSVVALLGAGAQRRAAVASVDTAARSEVLVVCSEANPLSAQLLRAQGRDVVQISPAELAASQLARQTRTMVLDRIGAAELSQPEVVAVLQQRAVRGLGWVHLPVEQHGDLAAPAAAPFAALLPARELPPAPAPPPPPEVPPEPKPDENLPPDPAQRTRENLSVPTLGIVVAIDASGSMQGEPLRLAKEAAWAAVQVLHPEDYIGVIAFNKEAKELLALTKAGDRDIVKDRIARIQSGGGTDFTAALELAEEMFAEEVLSVRHLILLSDGESEPGRFEACAQRLARAGITISTVGCGASLNVRDLSNIAAHGGGKFYPAYSLNEVPEIFTIEAERVIARSGARHAPAPIVPAATSPESELQSKPAELKPQAKAQAPQDDKLTLRKVRRAAEAALLQGVDTAALPGVADTLHLQATTAGTVALAADESPLLIHGQYGAARVVQFAVPLQGVWAPAWSSNAAVQVLLAQASAWSEGRDATEGARLVAEVCARTVLWRGEDLFTRHPKPEDAVLHVSAGEPAAANDACALGDLQWTSNPEPTAPALLATLELRGSGAQAHAAAAVPMGWQRACALPHTAGVDAWAKLLDAGVVLSAPPRITRQVLRAGTHAAMEWLAPLTALLLLMGIAIERISRQTLLRETAA